MICNSPPLRAFLSRSQANPDFSNPGTSANPLSSLVPESIVKSLYKTMATSLDDSILSPSMLDLMYTTLNRQLNDIGGFVGMSGEEITGLGNALLPSALRPTWSRTESGAVIPPPQEPVAGKVVGKASLNSGIQPMGGESGTGSFTAPICDLFIEVFDLKENNWLRRQAIVVILQQFLGGTIER
jgi:sorting nexin-25